LVDVLDEEKANLLGDVVFSPNGGAALAPCHTGPETGEERVCFFAGLKAPPGFGESKQQGDSFGAVHAGTRLALIM
jgi:hypothetical protein